jgi:hypothetical protein
MWSWDWTGCKQEAVGIAKDHHLNRSVQCRLIWSYDASGDPQAFVEIDDTDPIGCLGAKDRRRGVDYGL